MGLADAIDQLGFSIDAVSAKVDKGAISLNAFAASHGALTGKIIANTIATTTYTGAVEAGTAATKDSTNANLNGVDADAKLAAGKLKLAAAQDTLKKAVADGAAVTAAATARLGDMARSYQSLTIDVQLAEAAESGSAATIAAGIAVAGSATIANMVLAKATDAQTASLDALLAAYNALNGAVQNTLTVASGWNDWLAQLKSSFDSGAISVLSYRQALEDFETQLETQFPGAVGKAKDAITSMIGVINTLIATAGAGGAGSPDNSVSGALNKAFNTP